MKASTVCLPSSLMGLIYLLLVSIEFLDACRLSTLSVNPALRKKETEIPLDKYVTDKTHETHYLQSQTFIENDFTY